MRQATRHFSRPLGSAAAAATAPSSAAAATTATATAPAATTAPAAPALLLPLRPVALLLLHDEVNHLRSKGGMSSAVASRRQVDKASVQPSKRLLAAQPPDRPTP